VQDLYPRQNVEDGGAGGRKDNILRDEKGFAKKKHQIQGLYANRFLINIMANRSQLTNEQWERIEPLLPPQKPKTGRPAQDHRMILNGILWILHTGAPWRDLPERCG